jgi:membrane-associated phospholipid phosphatase
VVLAMIFLVMNITKLAYNQARPFWVSYAIEAGSCSSQFGNPSGHSLTSLGIALAVWFDYNQSVSDGKIARDSAFAQTWARVLTLIVALSFGVSIGWSRFVLGAHSMNQIIFGLLLAVWLATSFHYGVYHLFME